MTKKIYSSHFSALSMFVLLGALCLLLTACGCDHKWKSATCEEPKTCRLCGEIKGEALDHDWEDATCEEPKTCEECGETKGEPLGHTWIDATCEEPETCEECDETKGEPLGHTWVDATYETPKTCSTCKKTEGEVLANPGGDAPTEAPETDSNVGNSGDTNVIACTGLDLKQTFIELSEAGERQLLAWTVTPADTTELITFYSANSDVAMVDNNGLVIGVGYGQTTITVKCGTFEVTCDVVCTFGTPPVDSTPTTPTVPAGFVLKLKTYKDSGEVAFASAGTTHKLYTEANGVKATDITWSSSDDSVVTVDETGKITSVDRGIAYITATIGDQTKTCKVICNFDAPPPFSYELMLKDITIGIGESVSQKLVDKETRVPVLDAITWVPDKEGAVTISGNKITGNAVTELTHVTISGVYNDITYTFIIRVNPNKK